MRTAFINESMEIGLMELRLCIQAIIQASPELLAKSGQDYTVYAHDYSEHEAPLVGQGMLSSILAPSAAAHQQQVMITGRVCKNFIGFTTNGIQETLEVKIKLVPLPTDNMHHPNGFPGSFNPHAWNPLPNNGLRFTRQRGSFDAGFSHQQANEEGPARKRVKVTQADWTGKTAFGLHTTADSYALPRALLPQFEATVRSRQDMELQFHQNHPLGHLLLAPAIGASHSLVPSLNTEAFSDAADEVSNGSFTTSPADIDELGRGEFETTYNSSPPIFPIPDDMTVLSSPELPALSYTDQGPSDSGYLSDWPAEVGDIGVFPSVGDEFPWGPPAQQQSAQPQQSDQRQRIPNYDTNRAWVEVEPGPRDKLPTKVVPPRPHYREQRRREAMAQTAASSDVTERASGDSRWTVPTPNATAEHHPGLPISSLAPPKAPESNESFSRSAASTSQPWIPNISGASLPAPAHQQERNSNAHGLPGLQPAAANSPLDMPSDGPCQLTRSISRPPPGSSSGARRKHQIQATLKMSLEAGKMPPFCGNCGEIKTVTWRKIYTRVLAGEPRKDLIESQDPNEPCPIVGFEPIRDEITGHVASHRIYKKIISPYEQEHQLFEVLQLCNPCGLWVPAKGGMRPEHLWGPVDADDTAVRRRGRGRAGGRRTGGNLQPTSDIADVANSDLPDDQLQGTAEATTKAPSKRPAKRPRSSSVQPQRKAQSKKAKTAASSALNRGIQSSPVGRVPGSEASPIEIMSPEKNTTRLIFPSPRKDGEFKSLEGAPSVTPSPAKSQLPQVTPTAQEAGNPEPDQNKENCPPAINEPDEMAYLFDEGLINIQMTPKTTRDYLDLMKTPSRSPLSSRINGSSGSKSAATALFLPTTPSRNAKSPAPAMTPYTAAITQLLGKAPMADSPSRNFDFKSFSVDDTGAQFNFGDLEFGDLSGLMPTSPASNFFLYEDPATATGGMLEGLEGIGGGVEARVEGEQAGGETVGRESGRYDHC
ncbi:hypothetical protein H2199_006638 [Coniosporium tulheliwenetii]|uniref:Uncharacterized protein n=1 Tax=Coniosporium tulheliwenetii TaxID=3383036 RepID=A0ACC2YUW7_9PEZI|nr:hypothetical protein H2199_006638 [Cladosporium sp. JES 115]